MTTVFKSNQPTELIAKFEQQHDFNVRKTESERVMKKYDNKLALVAEPIKGDRYMEKYANKHNAKNKYLVGYDLTLAQFHTVIRKRLHLSFNDSIFIYCKDKTLPYTSQTMGQIYKEQASEDGFLYLFYGSESTFG